MITGSNLDEREKEVLEQQQQNKFNFDRIAPVQQKKLIF